MISLPLSRASACVLALGAVVFGGALGGACSDAASSPLAAPEGVTCQRTADVYESGPLVSALTDAAAGTCVLLGAESFTVDSLVLKEGVTLVAAKGVRARVTSTSAFPAITLTDGATLANVDVTGGRVGVAVMGSKATLRDVNVSGSETAFAAKCPGGCDAGTITLENVTLEKSGVGLWTSGAHVAMKGGRVAEIGGTSLTGGIGVVALDGASLELDSVTVEKTQSVGVLVDGPATKASLKSSVIRDNAGRGVWIQKVAGTIDAPSVRLEGCEVSSNRITGVGALEARGIIIIGGKVEGTLAAPVVTDLSKTEDVGDGIGIFQGTGDFKLDGVTLRANARAAGIVDAGERGIIIIGGKVEAGPSGLKVVVQRTTADVNVPASDRSTPTEPLGVSAGAIAAPRPEL